MHKSRSSFLTSSSAIWRAGLWLTLGLLAFGAGRLAFGQAAQADTHPTPAAPAAAPAAASTPAATPTPAPVVQAIDVPLDQDPNDPNASKEERMRRQRAYLERRIQMRRQRETPKATPTPTPKPTPATPGAKPNAPAAPAAPGKPGKPAKTVGGGMFSERALKPHVTIFLKPERDRVAVGQPFTVACMLSNPENQPMDSLEILLTYPSRLLKLTAVHQDKLRPLLDGEPEFSVDPQKGTLIYRAHFKDPVKTMNLPALTLVWEPLTPANQAKIEPCIDRFYSSVSWKGANLASGLMGSAGAVSGAKVQILAAGADASGLNDATVRSAGMFVGGMALTPNYEALQLKLDGFKDQAGLRPPTLWMNQPKAEMLQPGRVLMIDLGVDNPDGVVFDEIRAAAEYDPSAVEVIDSDKRNWIGKGINLLDGPFHREWPWDLHFANRVDPQRGLFYYHMGMTDLREQPSRAFARLFVRIKKPVQAPIFQWIWTRSADPDEPTTGIYLFNRNIYLKDQKPETRLEDLTASGERADPKVYEF